MPHNVPIRKARKDFLTYKERNTKPSTVRNYKSTIGIFIDYCERQGVHKTDEIDGHLIQQWKLARQREDDPAPITLKNNTKDLIVFLKWCASSELVASELPDKVDVPHVSREDSRSDETVTPSQVNDYLSYLEMYEYGSRLHAAIQLLWHTGCRISALQSLDIVDFEPSQNILKFRNRRESGTALKNGVKSERNVTLNDETTTVLVDYVEARRDDVSDDEGRNPLFTTSYGRASRQRFYKDFVALSRPCDFDGTCPHNRDVDECEAALNKKKAYDCPSSKSLHPIRRGSITYHLNQDWDVEKVSQRCDVSVDVLKRHYDVRTHEDKRESRVQDVDKL